MMGSPGMFAMMLWMPMVMLLGFALVLVVIWLIVRWLNNQKTPTMPYTRSPQNSYQTYEQGYQPQQQTPETYREGGEQFHHPQPQYEQPQAQYPQEQEMPPQQ